MDELIKGLLSKVEHNQEVVKVTFNENEFNSVNMALGYLCDYFVKYRDELESKDIDLPIQSSVFIDALISACNKLNDCDYEFLYKEVV